MIRINRNKGENVESLYEYIVIFNIFKILKCFYWLTSLYIRAAFKINYINICVYVLTLLYKDAGQEVYRELRSSYFKKMVHIYAYVY